jgi:cytidyltransferase-like protein
VTVALTIGTFDPVHVDHVVLFRRCERFADEVVVGVNSDRFCLSYRGRITSFSQDERLAQVRALGYTAHLNDGPGIELIQDVNPDYVVVGGDWLARDYLGQIGAAPSDFERIGLVYLPRGRTISSTQIRERE